MLFTSYGFIALVLITFVLYYTVFKNHQWQLLLLASYIYYFLSGKGYIIFIFSVTLTVYISALILDKNNERFKIQKAELKDRAERKSLKNIFNKKNFKIFLIGLILSISILIYAKYTDFLITNINYILARFSNSKQFNLVHILLPMGISFYTFMSVGYLIDVYRGKYRAERNFFKLALFVSFFPSIVQGPINRFDDMSKTLYLKHNFDNEVLLRGSYRLLWGYFKKMVVADRILIAVKVLIDNPTEYTGAFAFLGMIFYAIELYCDFTGGIDITIAIAEILGIKLKENFRQPYFSKSVKEYWRRWHITMGSFFTEYVFYPVSVSTPMLKIAKNSRKAFGDKIGKRIPVFLSTLIVWTLTGIWHGAGWNFVVWGLLNAIIILISEELKPVYKLIYRVFKINKDNFIYSGFCIIRTFLILSAFRMLDCYGDVPLTFNLFFGIFTADNWASIFTADLGLNRLDYTLIIISIVIMIFVSIVNEKMYNIDDIDNTDVRDIILKKSYFVRQAVLMGLFFAILIFGAYGVGFDKAQFIYNQF